MEISKLKLLSKHDNAGLDFGFRRPAEVTKLGATIRPFNIGSLKKELSEDSFHLIKHEVVVRVL